MRRQLYLGIFLWLWSLGFLGCAMQRAPTLEMAESVSAPVVTNPLSIALPDGETLKGKLYLPKDGPVEHLVIYVHGTGPGTYLNRRLIGGVDFSYFDLFGAEFNARGIAFFSYSKRGVEMSETPPMYDAVDREKFKKVVPTTEVNDLGVVIQKLREMAPLKGAKVSLLGWSEGTVISAMVAEKAENEIHALLLAGYAHETVPEIIKWQYSGASSMLNLNPAFDTNGDKQISPEEFASESKAAVRMRKAMKGTAFDILDANGDGVLQREDFRLLVEPQYTLLLSKIEEGDADWVWKNYFRISLEWLAAHAALAPNKERLLRLDLPIYIFHGDVDANASVEGVYDIKARFSEAKKENLQTFIFAGHDHDLLFVRWPLKNEISPGIRKIFDVVEGFKTQKGSGASGR